MAGSLLKNTIHLVKALEILVMYRIPPEQRLTPERSGVIAARLPLHPVPLVREDGRTLSSGLRAPVEVVAEHWNDMIRQRNLLSEPNLGPRHRTGSGEET